VIAELVALAQCASRDVPMSLQVATDDEEGRARTSRIERVEDRRRDLGIGAVVERQRHARSIARTV
jgi:hypothetical protein